MRRLLFISFFCLLVIASGLSLVYLLAPSSPPADIVRPVLQTLHLTPAQPIVYGFLPYWSLSNYSDTYASQFTHIGYFSLTLEPDGSIRKLDNPTESEPGWANLQKPSTAQLLQQLRDRHVALSLVIFSGNSPDIDQLIADPVAHARTTHDQIAPVIDSFGFSDLNIDIEDPGEVDSDSQQRFTQYVRTLRELFHSSHPALTFSLDYISISTVRPRLTYLPQLEPFIDHFIVMAYDYHSPGSSVAGPVAPASGSGEIRAFDTTAAINSALVSLPSRKLILGTLIYGYMWDTLSDIPGSATIPRTGRTVTAQKADELIAACPDCTTSWDAAAQEMFVLIPRGPGLYSQLYYGNQEALAHKLQTVTDLKLGGLAIWALGYESPTTLTPLSSWPPTHP